MRMSTEARDARKKAQLARIDKKGDADYPTLYASQPGEITKHARQSAARMALRAVQTAADEQMTSDATGAVGVFSGQLATASGDGS